MKKLLGALLKRNASNSNPIQQYTYGLDNLNDDVIGDLPDPQGIPLVQTRIIAERMDRELRFIKSELGLDETEFNTYFAPIFLSLIEFVDLLPASEYKHHATGGGLIYHSCDVAKRGMRAAQHTQFPNKSGIISDTQQSRKQWKTATVIACLMHDCGKVITDMVVTNGKDSERKLCWDPHGLTISKWAEKHKIERYFVEWTSERHNKHQAASLTVMQRLVPQKTWSWINSAPEGKFIHNCLLGFLSDQDGNNPISKIVSECDAESVRQDMFHNRSQITKQLKRIPISELLADIMSFNILERKWTINSKAAKVWYVDDELYISWEAAVPEMIDEVIKGGFSIPEVPTVLAKIMVEEGMAKPFSKEEVYHTIYPIVLGDKSKPVPLRCLKMTNPSRIILRINKVYSIEQHQTADAEKNAIQKVDEKESSKGTVSPIKKKAPVETAVQTMQRVLTIMKADQDNSQVDTHDDNPSEDIVAEIIRLEPVISIPQPEPEKVAKVVTGHGHEDEIVNFILSNFQSLALTNNVLYIPEVLLDEISGKLCDAGIEGINEFSVVSKIRSNNYVSIVKE